MLFDRYIHKRTGYIGTSFLSAAHVIDTEHGSRIIAEMRFGKAPDMAGLTAEH